MASATGTIGEAPTMITVYGADWCPDCGMAKAVLDTAGVPYDYVDLEAVEDAHVAAEEISGQKHIPVVVFPDGVWYVEPTKQELVLKIEALSMEAGQSTIDGLVSPCAD